MGIRDLYQTEKLATPESYRDKKINTDFFNNVNKIRENPCNQWQKIYLVHFSDSHNILFQPF
jgi:hypothetical protein